MSSHSVASPEATTEASRPGLLKSSAIVGVGTALSRITGLLRTVVLAYALGKLVLADSYNLANTTPNIVYDLILGGVLSDRLPRTRVLVSHDVEGTLAEADLVLRLRQGRPVPEGEELYL